MIQDLYSDDHSCTYTSKLECGSGCCPVLYRVFTRNNDQVAGSGLWSTSSGLCYGRNPSSRPSRCLTTMPAHLLRLSALARSLPASIPATWTPDYDSKQRIMCISTMASGSDAVLLACICRNVNIQVTWLEHVYF